MAFRDLTVLLGVVTIVIMLIIPLPTGIIDFLIIINISLALLIILVAMNTKEALQFSIFPTLLLLVTLFRLGLNVSTTRAILGNHGDAGNVIETFGDFVVGGNALVGFVIFIILVVIQFIVITKGAERVSEVGARFTLDAMPGKQMSIDADLNAGMISDTEAKERRKKIEQEADFYGSMDGASKFVKGDAIAGIVIVLMNIIFGLVIGMMQEGLPLGAAADKYTLLTVGDGLVSQIPALLVSTATGIIVTRAASEGNLGHDVTRQLFAYPKMLYVAGITIFLLGAVTPIEWPIPTLVAIMLCAGGYFMGRQEHKPQEDDNAEERQAEEEEFRSPESVVSLISVDPVEFEFGYGLIPLADANQGGDLLDRVVMIRRQLAIELGMVVPVIRIRDNIQLKPGEYVIKVKGNEVARGELLLDHYMAMSPGEEDSQVTGIDTIEPAFGLPALWISEEVKEQAEYAGYTVVDPPSVVSTHLTEVIKRYAHELLGRGEAKQLVEHLRKSYSALVEDVTPEPLGLGDIQKVLSRLLREKVPVRNLPVIFETLADYGQMTKDTDLLTEYVRQSLSRQISSQFTEAGQPMFVVTLSGSAEKMISDAVQQTEHGNFLALSPEQSQDFVEQTMKEMERMQQGGHAPVILCSPAVRMYVRHLIERYMPHIPVLSYNELEPEVEVQSTGVVKGS
ncbi:flagellar biosynthesis protein FlhA [Alteribacter lacisalsi]|uniref:Flagellar biosynthesis protein FlhA n=1 Tax=Alteribacter lacisalsi TaxID=2045244 RepID=A0A2W0H845_9BACI|nr:flagellar biosynthesis protein FlhA [Alteribacter lacisalsi]PYZ98033.1 flagellar biosynthesis protein FlhA [Alteribacter lacisalsi]